jgi:hypothetical protein
MGKVAPHHPGRRERAWNPLIVDDAVDLSAEFQAFCGKRLGARPLVDNIELLAKD